MPEYQLNINEKTAIISAPEEMPLLWVLRDLLHLTGTKYGCGLGICGICTVHIDGRAVRSCLLTIAQSVGKKITTIEGLSKDGQHPVQQAWREANVPQCGYCQPGQMMQAAALINQNAQPGKVKIRATMSTVLCRCGTYPRIKKAFDILTQKKK